MTPINLAGVSPQAALRLSLAYSAKTPKEIAEGMGWGNSIAARVFFSGNYFPKYVDIPKYCDVVGNNIMIYWLLKNRRHPDLKFAPMDALGLLRSMGSLLKEMSDVSARAQSALQDWDISRNEARGIIRELRDVLEVGCYIISRLGSITNDGDR